MISIRKAANEIDRMEELLHSLRESYGHAMHSTAQYAIEMDPVEAREFREHLRNLQKQIESSLAAEEWKAAEASFDGELRDYRDKALGQLKRLHEEIQATGEAVRLFAESVAAIDLDHETQIKEAMGQLEDLAQSVDVEKMQTGIRSASLAISGSLDAMRRRHQASIAELRDEIRLLHKQIDGERKAQFVDAATGVWNRRKLDSDIADLLERDEPFCILLVCVRNLTRLEQRYPPGVIELALQALLQRFAGLLEDGALIGRWDERNFAALLAGEPAAAFGLSRLATKKLSGDYSVQKNGRSRNIFLQAVAGVIDRSAGADRTSFEQKLLQMSQTLAQA